jgi:mannitol-1-/sugar-/sorbitol-6-phosphatase
MASQVTRLACKALLFDLDGVLVDSVACIEQVWRRWAAQHDLDPAAVLRIAHGRRAVEIVQLAAPHLDASAESAALVAREVAAAAGVREAAGARALLQRLPADSWAVVTSGVRLAAESRLRSAGLPMPTVLVSADEVSSGKPDPEGYLAAATRLGVSPRDCIVVEDAPLGLAAACAAGMRAIGLATTHPPHALGAATVIAPALHTLIVHLHGTRPGHRIEIELLLS